MNSTENQNFIAIDILKNVSWLKIYYKGTIYVTLSAS